MCSLCLVKIMAILQLENSGRCQNCETFDSLSSHGCMLKHRWWISQKECNLNIVSQGASYTPRQYCTGCAHQKKTEVKTSKWNWTSYLGQEFLAFPDHSWNISTETWNYSWDSLSSAEDLFFIELWKYYWINWKWMINMPFMKINWE